MKQLNNKLKDINEKANKIITSKLFNQALFVLGILVICTYFGFYMFKQPIVDEEVRPEYNNNLVLFEVKEGESFLKEMIKKPFNLNITEFGQYRPRYMAFLVQFLDENIFLKTTRLVPIFGNRQPFYIISMFLTVISMVYFIKSIWKKCPNGLALFISSTLLLFQNYQVATYWRARSAKLLALSACIFLIAYIINHLEINLEKGKLKKVWLAIPIFLLMTLDEQVLAIGALLLGLSVLFSIINKKVNLSSVIMAVSCTLYASFHLWWGKALFKHFTGTIKKHGHTIGGSIAGISIDTFKESLEILSSTIPKIIFLSFWIFLIVWLYCFIKMIIDKNISKKERLKKAIIAVFIVLAAAVLLMLMIDAHHPIYKLPCLWKSVYPLISTVILFSSLLYLLANTNFKYNFMKYFIVIVGLSVSLIYNVCHVSSSYYGAYLAVNGGFMTTYTDLIVTKDDIKIKEVKAEDMNPNNDNFKAVLNTVFSTSDIKTTKVLYGKTKNSDYIDTNLAAYLVVKKNRNLYLDLELKDYKKFESVDIILNNDKIKSIPINSNNISEKLYATTEVNRACKVELRFKTKKNVKVNKKDIKLEKLYMN